MTIVPVRRAAQLAVAGLCAMSAVFIHAAVFGQFSTEGGRLIEMPWGRATLVDVYVGLLLFCAWILFRERNGFVSGAWVLVVLATGNLGTCCYVLKAVATCDNDTGKFWMGERHES